MPPISEIPAEATPEVRQLIEILCTETSKYNATDCWGSLVSELKMSVMADELGAMGEDAAPAVPWLMGLLVECQRLRIGFEAQESAALQLDAVQPFSLDPDRGPRSPWPGSGEEFSGTVGVNSADIEAARALVRIGKPAIVPLLRAAQMDPEFWLVRARAIEALGFLREPSAIGIVCQSLKDAHPVVRRAAAEALERLSTAPTAGGEKGKDRIAPFAP
ncbi:MAG: HEAT repeat domain-containing protein [Candidatus Sumerlaeota bacterium]|nr:HEAT repeat domain-containing protein [Candidatus Sumerlaeota bacterium]